jgi:hypothetical protein
MFMRTVTRRLVLGAAVGLGFAPGAAVAATATQKRLDLQFVLHAAFFSGETHQAKPLDPQVFVADAAAAAGAGPQNISHAAGFRPVFLSDPPGSALFNANGNSLGMTLAEWMAAKGTVRIAPAGDAARCACRFTGLRPNGVYSLFENHFDQNPVGFTPLDGSGQHNSFTADAHGRAAVSVRAPHRLTHDNAVLLVWHSDNKTHGAERGEIGVTAHHQIIARPPA